MIDANGKLFGRMNIIDAVLVTVMLAALGGLLWAKAGQSPINNIVKARGSAEVTVAIRGIRAIDPGVFKVGEKAFLTIRNQRYAPVEVTKVDQWQRKITFLNSKDQVMTVPDPTTPEVRDINLTFRDQAELTDEGIVLGGHHVKVGNSVELDAFGYRLNASIMHVQFKEQ
jgi:hypothetical protein